MTFGALHPEPVGSHTEDEWQALVRKYAWRCFYCGSPVSAWQDGSGKVFQIRGRNVERLVETSGKMMTFVQAQNVAPEHILTKDHLVSEFHCGARVDAIWNIRPACLRCNRMKGQKSITKFRDERPGLIETWLNSLPADDWRVREWDGFPSTAQIEEQIEYLNNANIRFVPCVEIPQSVDGQPQGSTGVFALALSGVAVASPLPVNPPPSVEKVQRQERSTTGLRGNAFAVASTPLPLCSSAEERINEPDLLKKVVRERDRDTSWAWRNPA